MKNSAKVLVTLGVIFLFFIIAIPITAGIKSSGGSSTFITLILFVGLIGAIKSIWSKPKQGQERNGKDDDTSILQK